WSVGRAVGSLLGASVLAAWMSEILVGAAEGTGQALGMSDVFIGIVFLAVIGGAAESGSAHALGPENKPGLTGRLCDGLSMHDGARPRERVHRPPAARALVQPRRNRHAVPGCADRRHRRRRRARELVQGRAARARLRDDRHPVLLPARGEILTGCVIARGASA